MVGERNAAPKEGDTWGARLTLKGPRRDEEDEAATAFRNGPSKKKSLYFRSAYETSA